MYIHVCGNVYTDNTGINTSIMYTSDVIYNVYINNEIFFQHKNINYIKKLFKLDF